MCGRIAVVVRNSIIGNLPSATCIRHNPCPATYTFSKLIYGIRSFDTLSITQPTFDAMFAQSKQAVGQELHVICTNVELYMNALRRSRRSHTTLALETSTTSSVETHLLTNILALPPGATKKIFRTRQSPEGRGTERHGCLDIAASDAWLASFTDGTRT